MSLTQVLVVEDDASVRMGICDALESARYVAIGVESGEEGVEQLHSSASFDLVLLDVILPGINGMQVLQKIRELNPTMPVIMLTAKGDLQDRLQGLNLGADDYVVKPFNVRELLARIEAVLRRSLNHQEQQEEIILQNGIRIDLIRREVCFMDETRIELSELETDLLRYLSSRAGNIISRNELIERVWQINPKGMRTRTVDMHIARLRKKLGDEGETPELIVTVRGRGYRFEMEEEKQ